MSQQIVPHIPIWAREGHKVVRQWEEVVRSGDAAEGIGTFVEYLDKKGKPQTTMKRIVWLREWEGCDYSNVNPYLKAPRV